MATKFISCTVKEINSQSQIFISNDGQYDLPVLVSVPLVAYLCVALCNCSLLLFFVSWRTLLIIWYLRQRLEIKVQGCPVLRCSHK